MKKLSVIVGTRPEAIKMAPVILELNRHSTRFDVSVCSTGQHTTMLEGAFSAFGISPDETLDVMRPGQSLSSLTSRLLLAFEGYFNAFNPDLVLVHGDTTTAMTGAMSAFYHQIAVGHVEAGLRTNNMLSPFPEEYNRRSVAIATEHHFAPTQKAQDNLLREGVNPNAIIQTGNTVIDALLLAVHSLESNAETRAPIQADLCEALGFAPDRNAFVLITAHRRENHGKGIEDICKSIRILADQNPGLRFVYPVHLNPKVKTVVEARLGQVDNVSLIAPQDYLHFAWLMKHCLLVLTDSGGIQEEAPALGKPVLVMRDTSERPEAIEAGTAKLVTTDPEVVVRETQALISDQTAHDAMAKAVNPFGDGHAAERIAQYLLQKLEA